MVRAGGHNGWVFSAEYSRARNGFHDRAPFSLFSPFTRERKRFENVFKTFQNTLKCVSIFVPHRYRFRALSCKRL